MIADIEIVIEIEIDMILKVNYPINVQTIGEEENILDQVHLSQIVVIGERKVLIDKKIEIIGEEMIDHETLSNNHKEENSQDMRGDKAID